MITGAPDVGSSYETEQLSEEANWQEAAGLKTAVELLLPNDTVSSWMEPETPETVAVHVVEEPEPTEPGAQTREAVATG